MKIIGPVFSHDSIQSDKRLSNKVVRESKPLPVHTYKELVEMIAQIAYKNREYDLFYRGQDKEYLRGKQAAILPSIYRCESNVRSAFSNLESFVKLLLDRQFRFEHDDTFDQFDEVKWAILQHYEVCVTPLLDLTRSLRVACTFALAKAEQVGILYVFGLPLVNGSISFSVEEELFNLRLLGICPPQALRPQFQEGFLAGTFPSIGITIPYRKTYLYDKEKLDFNRRLIAKFELQKSTFWDKDFTPIPDNALFPKDDQVRKICESMKLKKEKTEGENES